MTEETEIHLDIETSSLDADSGMVVAVGCAEGRNEPETMFVKSYEDEETVMSKVFGKIKGRRIVTFNGTRFDIPFLIARALKYDSLSPRNRNG